MNSLFMQGFAYSALTIGPLSALAWWLYLSKIEGSARKEKTSGERSEKLQFSHPSLLTPGFSRLSYTLALLIGIAALLISFGTYWDISEHIITGIVPGGEDFLWPPHLMIYAGFLLALLVALGGLAALGVPNLKAGINDPRRWVRRNPYVAATVLVAGYGVLSIPGDAIWHELYGIDLTAWSPPHIFLGLSASFLAVFGAALLGRGERNGRREERGTAVLSLLTPLFSLLGFHSSRADWRGVVQLLYLAMALLLFLPIGSVEWELGTVDGFVARRPIWLYPTIIGGASFFLLLLGRRMTSGPWTATVFALFYFGLRLAATSFADLVSGSPPRLTLVFILGAFFVDLTCRWMARSGFRMRNWQTALAASGVFVAGYTAVAQPTIQYYLLQFLPSFTISDHLLTILFTFLLCAALYPLALGLGNWLQHSAERTPGSEELPGAVAAPATG